MLAEQTGSQGDQRTCMWSRSITGLAEVTSAGNANRKLGDRSNAGVEAWSTVGLGGV